MKHLLLRWLLPVLLLFPLAGPAWATTPSTTGPSLATALNPDGTLRPGASGSFDARQFCMSTAPDGRPVFRPAGTTGAGDERWANGFSIASGADGQVTAVVQSGNDTYIGGDFTSIGPLLASHVARWNGVAWSSLGTGSANGVNGSVTALAVASNGDLFAGGLFTKAGGATANNVARWNGASWSSLGNGTGSQVLALAVAANGNVYAGGYFTIAQWNGTAWSSLGTGVNNWVMALAVATNGDVYAGGNFTQAGGAPASRVARWNGTAWNSLGAGVANTVTALALASNGDVIVGGYFTQAGGSPANRVARWNGSTWTAMGSGMNYLVNTLVVAGNGDVYAGGQFTQAGGVAASHVAKWNGSAWSNLGLGTGGGDVLALATSSTGTVYAGGNFVQTGGVNTSSIAQWNGIAWSSVGTSPAGGGVNSYIDALAVAPNGDVYAGGSFTQAGGIAANYVAKWNGTAWSPLGTGSANGVNNTVTTLALAANGDVYVAGYFTQAGGAAANNVARWNGTAWSPLGTGLDFFGFVNALAIAGNGDVYIGGRFTQAGGIPANYVARWNGTAWGSLGAGPANGVNAEVGALAIASNGDLYAGGSFTQAGGIAANYVARWNGAAWSPLGTGSANGVSGGVGALAVAGNGNLYVGGQFTAAGGIATNNIARWDGAAWSSLGTGVGTTSLNNGIYDYILEVAVDGNGNVYAGGEFTEASGNAANRVAKWNGTTWESLGTGANRFVSALAIGQNSKLYAGGGFTTTGDGSKIMVRFGIYDPNAPLATTASRKAAPAALFPNPAHSTATLRLPAGAPRLPLTLTDALGRTVRRYPAPPSAEVALDLRGLPAGVYVVRCGDISQRLVVE